MSTSRCLRLLVLVLTVASVSLYVGVLIGREEQAAEAFAARGTIKSSVTSGPSRCGGTLPGEASSVRDDGRGANADANATAEVDNATVPGGGSDAILAEATIPIDNEIDASAAAPTDPAATGSNAALLGQEEGKTMTEEGRAAAKNHLMPIHMVQFGEMRTASTLQYEIVCTSLFLKLFNDTTVFENRTSLLNDMKCHYSAFKERPRLEPSKPKVVKTHFLGPFNNFAGWMFTTARTREEARRKKEELEGMGHDIMYIQDLETVAEKGHHIVNDYAKVFELNPTQRDNLLEYIRYWDILRVCCGKQMSAKWLNEMMPLDNRQNYSVHYPAYHACSIYDIDRVEELFRGTIIYKEMIQHKNLNTMARPSQEDSSLTGTYCSNYNKKVRKKGVRFARAVVPKSGKASTTLTTTESKAAQLGKDGGGKKKTEDGPRHQIPINIVQRGAMRTATTLQFQIISISLFLKLLDGQTFQNGGRLVNSMTCYCTTLGKKLDPWRPTVVKTHGPLPQNFTGWMFETARTREEAGRRREELEAVGFVVPYIQDLETLAEKGHHIVEDYANVFHLTQTQMDRMLDYLRYWDILRICCGKQMSEKWRNELMPLHKRRNYSVHYPTYHACSMYDIDRVEELYRGTAIYKEIVQYGNLKSIARPSQVDRDLNGTYCSSYNNLVRTKGVGFNKGEIW